MLLPGVMSAVMPAMGIRPAPAYAAVILAHTVIYAYAAVLAAGAVFIHANAAALAAEAAGANAVLAAGAAFVSAYAVIKAAAAALARAAACAPCRFVPAVGIGGQRKGRKDSQRKDNGKKLFHNMLPFIQILIYNNNTLYIMSYPYTFCSKKIPSLDIIFGR